MITCKKCGISLRRDQVNIASKENVCPACNNVLETFEFCCPACGKEYTEMTPGTLHECPDCKAWICHECRLLQGVRQGSTQARS